jgi:hypothetical protein
MRVTRLSDSEGGGNGTTRPSLPLSPQTFGNAPSTDWIPAFAGMTGVSKGIASQMTPTPVAHIAAVTAGALVYTAVVAPILGAAGLLWGISTASPTVSTGVLLVSPVRLTTMVKAAG